MIYGFKCYDCELGKDVDARPFTPPTAPRCPTCGERMDRVYGCQIDFSGCKDPDDVPVHARTAICDETNLTPGQVAAMECRDQQAIEAKRAKVRAGGNRGSIRMSASVPAALHAAKIKETGDLKYWDDPKNRNRHKSCKVD